MLENVRQMLTGETVRRILAGSDRLRLESEAHLRTRAVDLGWSVRTSRALAVCEIEVFSLVREIARRCYGFGHHPVQVQGALAMSQGRIAEMQTGEGKTLTALMPITLFALLGRGCHVLTANDYLAQRDAAFAAPVLGFFGLTCRSLSSKQQPDERATCYAADVTYGTEREFGFDYLRDRLAKRTGNGRPVQREHFVAVIDEADSILIDQARTPLIISVPREIPQRDRSLYRWCHRFARQLSPNTDYQFDPRFRSGRLTATGSRRALLAPKPPDVTTVEPERMYQQIERSLVAIHGFSGDRDYLVSGDQIEIIDQGTGRILPGRKWQQGMQQAIEVAAGVEFSEATAAAAQITLQRYLKTYRHLCGMTGTATDVRSELRRVYGLGVSRIPTHRSCRRVCLPTRIYGTMAAKLQAVAESTRQLVDRGRAILIGTVSVAHSEECARLLEERGLEPLVLHARNHADEAGIIAQAGQPGRVTVATNMAGRGTDIRMTPQLARTGGLHVLATEMNRSARIDRQLAGRCARQGDPGSYQLYLSLEDSLLENCGRRRARRLRRRRHHRNDEVRGGEVREFRRAQKILEKQDARERSSLLKQEEREQRDIARMGCDQTTDLLAVRD